MNFKGSLYLPIEIKVRELDSKLLLAYYASKRGYHVIIGDHILVENAADHLPAGIFFSKGYPRGFRKKVITNAKHSRHHVVELDEEGLLVQGNNYLSGRMTSELLDLVTYEFCWGKYQKDLITSANPEMNNKCRVTGNPRIDLLKPKFQSIYEEEVEKLKVTYGDFVLINTRFSRYNTAKGKKENPHFRLIKKLFYLYMDMIRKTCDSFPDLNIVIRPHPGESMKTYQQAFSSYKNVHVIREGNIVKWLMAAQIVIHNGCTSGIEAFLLGKRLISYVPPYSSEDEISMPNQLGVKARNAHELHNFIKIFLKDDRSGYLDYFSGLSEDELSYYCNWDKETHAYESILSLCDTIPLLGSEPVGTSLPKKILYPKGKKSKRQFSLQEEEIQAYFQKLNKLEDNSFPVKITKLAKNLFEIHSR
ncbi:surface carbohydrate biosynthesis protein [Halalkalibacillus halophilus]|uniref:surface carbohydrate biosynthesis protein n=1 Tax=Halalkalibacillus halophilus TaxID=392827 RepID=UPI000424858E|nr:surface carbohydrate biosynthesis protein [Halalkalibacillus halophilus]